MPIKIGLGEDSHQFTKKNKKLILGGVEIKGAAGLKANSDGDVILHAVCNAFDVVAQKGSLSSYADKFCLKQGIKDSSKYVSYVKKIATNKGWGIANVSISLEAKTPKLEPYSKKIKQSLAQILEIKPSDVGLTFTSGENLSAFGKGKGIRATALVVFKKYANHLSN